VNNEIAVANYWSKSVAVFARTASGNVPPLRTIAGASTGLGDVSGIALDTVNNEIAVTNSSVTSGVINVFPRTASGNAPPLRTIAGAPMGGGPHGIVVDTVNNEIDVTSYDSIRVFPRTASGNAPPCARLPVTLAG
jgi:DNA-binding beta-propeller fold protein YncE